jgi:hypothetical protein
MTVDDAKQAILERICPECRRCALDGWDEGWHDALSDTPERIERPRVVSSMLTPPPSNPVGATTMKSLRTRAFGAGFSSLAFDAEWARKPPNYPRPWQ